METIAPADLLVAVADPHGRAALAMGDKLYAKACAVDMIEAEIVRARKVGNEGYAQRREALLRQVRRELEALDGVYYGLLEGLPDAEAERIEDVVWRDRVAEYARNREIRDRFHANH